MMNYYVIDNANGKTLGCFKTWDEAYNFAFAQDHTKVEAVVVAPGGVKFQVVG